MRILVTNDDGFDAPGLAVLARGFAEAGHEVLVSPSPEASGSGAGIGPLRAMGAASTSRSSPPRARRNQDTRRRRAPGTDRDHGLPRCVRTAADLVASGINPVACRTCRTALRDGGAALTSAQFG